MAKKSSVVARAAQARESLAGDHWSRGDQTAPLRIDMLMTGEDAAAIRGAGRDGVDISVACRRVVRMAIEGERARPRMRELERVLLDQSEYMGLITKKNVELANAYNALAAAYREQISAIQDGFDKQTGAMESHLEASRHAAEEIANGSTMMLLNLQAFDEVVRGFKDLGAK